MIGKKKIYLILTMEITMFIRMMLKKHFNLLNEQNPEYNIRKKFFLIISKKEVIDGVKVSPQTKFKVDEANLKR
ncbi:MAG: hypothetical protein Ct9H90mP3_4240 [Flammeovirgaceae bacterium]|nr:MAG: hypothetical protein Ct9H90mP3_4240 [Flammeovirgaceae bacterium]